MKRPGCSAALSHDTLVVLALVLSRRMTARRADVCVKSGTEDGIAMTRKACTVNIRITMQGLSTGEVRPDSKVATIFQA